MTSSVTSGRHLSKFEKTAENAASDGEGSNFSGTGLPFSLAQPIGGFLVHDDIRSEVASAVILSCLAAADKSV